MEGGAITEAEGRVLVVCVIDVPLRLRLVLLVLVRRGACVGLQSSVLALVRLVHTAVCLPSRLHAIGISFIFLLERATAVLLLSRFS